MSIAHASMRFWDLHSLAIRTRGNVKRGYFVAQVPHCLRIRIETALDELDRHAPFVGLTGYPEPMDMPDTRRQHDRHRSGTTALVGLAFVLLMNHGLRRANAKWWL